MARYETFEAPLRNKWTDIFRRDALIHLSLMASIVAATFQGYLKDRMGGPIPYALADVCFMAGAALWFAGLAIRHEPIRGPGWVPQILLALALIPTAYLLYPTAPLVIQLAGLRAWVEFPVGCLIAMTIIRNAGQARAYVGLVLLLCVITAVYGIAQYQAGPSAALGISGLAQMRHGSSTFYFIPGTGRTGFRAFSTFTFPAPFGMMMVFGILLAMGVVVARLRSAKARLVALLLVPLLFFGMTVSGTRAALLILAGGLVLVAWFRRLSIGQILLVPLLMAAFHVASLFTSGGAAERFRTILLEEGIFWRYVSAPLSIAGKALEQHALGLGLGRSGVGVPFSMFIAQPPGFFVGSDGDIGRAGVEMGIIGIVLLALIIFALLPYAARAARILVGTDAEDIALGAAPLIVGTGVGVLIGSPFASAPHGTIWWFLLGALLKLAMIAEEENREEGRGKREE